MTQHPLLNNIDFVHSIAIDSLPEHAVHVNNVQFVAYFDEARTAFMEYIGYIGHDPATDLGYVVASNHCDYKAQLYAPDVFLIGVDAVIAGQHSIKINFKLVSQMQNLVAAEGYSVAISFDFKANRKTPVPSNIVEKLAALTH